jgi:peptidoglycan hydrolase-like protein with peptidoglycan-binding domain
VELFAPNTEEMPPEFADAEGDAELQDPGLTLETSTGDLRRLWADWLCHKGSGGFTNPNFFGKGIGGVAAPATDAFAALEKALRSTGYQPSSSWAYNCRNIAGTDNYSLHSFGIAIDIDPTANPFTTGDPYSGKIKAPHVAAVLAIKNQQGRSVWAWGGNWTKRDRMHFQIDVGPTAVEIDWSTVPGGGASSSASTTASTAAPTRTATTTITLEEETVLQRGVKGSAVERFQQYLLVWNPEALPEHGADGGYGSETVEWVKKYQEAMGLPVTGNIDGVTAALLVTEKVAARAAPRQR